MIYIINTVLTILTIIILKLNILGISNISPIGEGIYENSLYFIPSLLIFSLLLSSIYNKEKEVDKYYFYLKIISMLCFYTYSIIFSYSFITLYLILLALIINDIILNMFFKVKRFSYISIFSIISLFSMMKLNLYNNIYYDSSNFYLNMSIIPILLKEYISIFLFLFIDKIINNLSIRKWVKYYAIAMSGIFIIIASSYLLYYYETNYITKETPNRIKLIELMNEAAILEKNKSN